MLKRILIIVAILFISFNSSAQNVDNPSTFNNYVEELKQEAKLKGFDDSFLNLTFQNIIFYQDAVDKDKKQPEFVKPFSVYYSNLINNERIKNGKKMWKMYKTVAKKTEQKTGVQSKILISFWGVETNYGNKMGSYDILSATCTMAYDGRREGFFKNEFFASLKILKENHIKRENFKGSWAGAFGNFQFMPTTFNAYKDSYSDKKEIDIITNVPDAFASAGNYLKKMGWDENEKWGRIVIVPENALKEDITDSYKELTFFKKLGIKTIEGKSIPAPVNMKGKLILPSGANGPAFLVYSNFERILKWNRSNFYALSVVLLAEQIEGNTIKLNFPDERKYNMEEIENVQESLSKLKFYNGKIDGIMGSGMKKAIKGYQKSNGMLIDGYLSVELFEKLMQD